MFSVQSWYDQPWEAIEADSRQAGGGNTDDGEELGPTSSVGHGGTKGGEGGTAGQVSVSLVSVVVVDHHTEHREEHSQLEQDRVHQDTGGLPVENSDDSLSVDIDIDIDIEIDIDIDKSICLPAV